MGGGGGGVREGRYLLCCCCFYSFVAVSVSGFNADRQTASRFTSTSI